MDEILLKNSIRLLIGGYCYDTKVGDEDDEVTRLINTPRILRELADDYEKEINKRIEQ